MGMNLSLNISKGGMKAHQRAMDNVANNIANVSTDGYTAKSAHFAALLNNDMVTAGGDFTVNAGVRSDIVGNNFSQGSLIGHSSTLQLAVAGDGFFQVEDGAGNAFLTRDGGFFRDDAGQLVNAFGDYLVYDELVPTAAWPANEEIAVATSGEIRVGGELVGTIPIFQPESPASLVPVGGNKFDFEGVALQNADFEILQTYAEGSNVDLAQEFANMIVTQRAYSLNVKMAQANDETMQLINQFKQ